MHIGLSPEGVRTSSLLPFAAPAAGVSGASGMGLNAKSFEASLKASAAANELAMPAPAEVASAAETASAVRSAVGLGTAGSKGVEESGGAVPTSEGAAAIGGAKTSAVVMITTRQHEPASGNVKTGNVKTGNVKPGSVEPGSVETEPAALVDGSRKLEETSGGGEGVQSAAVEADELSQVSGTSLPASGRAAGVDAGGKQMVEVKTQGSVLPAPALETTTSRPVASPLVASEVETKPGPSAGADKASNKSAAETGKAKEREVGGAAVSAQVSSVVTGSSTDVALPNVAAGASSQPLAAPNTVVAEVAVPAAMTPVVSGAVAAVPSPVELAADQTVAAQTGSAGGNKVENGSGKGASGPGKVQGAASKVQGTASKVQVGGHSVGPSGLGSVVSAGDGVAIAATGDVPVAAQTQGQTQGQSQGQVQAGSTTAEKNVRIEGVGSARGKSGSSAVPVSAAAAMGSASNKADAALQADAADSSTLAAVSSGSGIAVHIAGAGAATGATETAGVGALQGVGLAVVGSGAGPLNHAGSMAPGHDADKGSSGGPSNLPSSSPGVSGGGDGGNGGYHTLVATPNVLEVGLNSGSHGWLRVRAELEPASGQVAASVIASSTASAQTLHQQVPAIAAYLASERIGVSSVSVDHTFASGSGLSFDSNGGRQQGSGEQQQTASGPDWSDAGGEWKGTTESLSGSTALPADQYAPSGGSWLSVMA